MPRQAADQILESVDGRVEILRGGIEPRIGTPLFARARIEKSPFTFSMMPRLLFIGRKITLRRHPAHMVSIRSRSRKA
jgi:hypothetical protein